MPGANGVFGHLAIKLPNNESSLGASRANPVTFNAKLNTLTTRKQHYLPKHTHTLQLFCMQATCDTLVDTAELNMATLTASDLCLLLFCSAYQQWWACKFCSMMTATMSYLMDSVKIVFNCVAILCKIAYATLSYKRHMATQHKNSCSKPATPNCQNRLTAVMARLCNLRSTMMRWL